MIHYDLRGILAPSWLQDVWLGAGGTTARIAELQVAQVLYALAIANQSKVIVESGIARCTTGAYLALAAKALGGMYYGIDRKETLCDSAESLLETHGLHDCSTIICGVSPKVIEERFEPSSIDLLFADDDHSAAHMEKEVEALLPLIRPGGLLCFHDVLGAFPIWDIVKKHGGIKLVNHAYNQAYQEPFGGLGVVVC